MLIVSGWSTEDDMRDLTPHLSSDTPYEGTEFSNWPRYTILRGKIIWANGEIVGKVRDGKYVKRGPSLLSQGSPRADRDPRRVASWLYE